MFFHIFTGILPFNLPAGILKPTRDHDEYAENVAKIYLAQMMRMRTSLRVYLTTVLPPYVLALKIKLFLFYVLILNFLQKLFRWVRR